MFNDTKKITLLGSTGSIGRAALDVIAHHPDRFEVIALTAGRNITTLVEQTHMFKPKYIAIADAQDLPAITSALNGADVRILTGKDGIAEIGAIPTDIVISAIVGIAGLPPTLAAAQNSCVIALANKESLICAGNLLLNPIKKNNGHIIPIDSEHNAILQALAGNKKDMIERIILTASGGPFRTYENKELKNVTPEQALKHPNWSMGAKITIDSATLMNKGLELIEAYHLFPVSQEQLDILIHPQSIIHGLVEYKDGSVIAQMGMPDMRTPISHALAYPERLPIPTQKLRLEDIRKLDFEPIDHIRFPAPNLCLHTLKKGGSAPVILNAANEIAVDAFLARHITFTDIIPIIERTLTHADKTGALVPMTHIEDIFQADMQARAYASDAIKQSRRKS